MGGEGRFLANPGGQGEVVWKRRAGEQAAEPVPHDGLSMLQYCRTVLQLIADC